MSAAENIRYPDPGHNRKGRPVTRGRLRPLDTPLLSRTLSGSTTSTSSTVFTLSPPTDGSGSDSEQEGIFKFRPPPPEPIAENKEHQQWLHQEFGIPYPSRRPRTPTMSRASNRPNHIPLPPSSMTRVSPNGSPGAAPPLASPTSPRSGFLSGFMSRSRSRANTVTGRNSPRLEQPDPMTRATARRDGGGVTRSVSTPVVAAEEPPAPTGPPIDPTGRTHRLRLVPNLENARSLAFEPVVRELFPIEVSPGLTPSAAAASISTLGPLVNNRPPALLLKLGRYTDRSSQHAEDRPATGISGPTLTIAGGGGEITNGKVAFKSKVVSRSHAEIWCDPNGKFFIRDTASSSGTFLNNIRLSSPNAESRPTQINDGDVLQLGVDYQGGQEDMFRCIKMRVELGRDWQRSANEFNTNALKQLKALGGDTPSKTETPSRKKSSVTDCCICLFSVTVCQSLFIAPCSHVFHYKCIRPLLQQHHPGFSCPLCRTFANLEEDVETEDAWEIASRRVSVISRRPSNHSIRLPRDERTSATAAEAPEGDPSSSVAFGAGQASVQDLLAGAVGTGEDSADSASAGADSVDPSDVGHTASSDPFLLVHPPSGTDAAPANIPISPSAAGSGSRRASNDEPETAMVQDLQTPRNDYFLSTFSGMAIAGSQALTEGVTAQGRGEGQGEEAVLGEPSMLQQLERAGLVEVEQPESAGRESEAVVEQDQNPEQR